MTTPSHRPNTDLKVRTRSFARRVRSLIKSLQKTFENVEDMKQLLRSSGSVAANYLEADEALSKKDFCNRCKICRKEAKESSLWLDLLDSSMEKEAQKAEHAALLRETEELIRIFSAIIRRSGFEHSGH